MEENNMNENKGGETFIPCGNSTEKMEELTEDALENVSGGLAITMPPDKAKPMSLELGTHVKPWVNKKGWNAMTADKPEVSD